MPDCQHNECSNLGYEYTNISLPVELKPTATIGTIEVECCGDPCFIQNENSNCKTCKAVISQKVFIRVPITYKVTACVGDSMICCDDTCCDD